jgi:hypothetical protein
VARAVAGAAAAWAGSLAAAGTSTGGRLTATHVMCWHGSQRCCCMGAYNNQCVLPDTNPAAAARHKMAAASHQALGSFCACREMGWDQGDCWFAHCVKLDDKEMDLFAARGIGIAHCPYSNLRLASGICPVKKLRERGVNVGLGVDGSASNDAGHMLAEARLCMLLQRAEGELRGAGRGAGGGGDGVLVVDAARLVFTGVACVFVNGAHALQSVSSAASVLLHAWQAAAARILSGVACPSVLLVSCIHVPSASIQPSLLCPRPRLQATPLP